MTDDLERQYEEFRRDTLWDLPSQPFFLWEPFGDTRNKFPSADPNTRIAMAERLLRELWRDGWARFVRLSEDPGEKGDQGKELDDDEIETVITSDVWRTDPLTGDALQVVLLPTEKTRSWQTALLADVEKRHRHP